MSKPPFSAVWERIKRHAGEEFVLIRGGRFTYRVDGSEVVTDRPNARIHRGQFEQAYERVPLENTRSVADLWGPSYLYAILMDPRIRQGEW